MGKLNERGVACSLDEILYLVALVVGSGVKNK